jgi:alkanesulfonate monooxygenase SsuD/methylene tetrahydromethanopterin reductase-like flavin-dependent oxidoreductase (luciferase family)
MNIEPSRIRLARLAEAIEVIDGYFTRDSVDFAGTYYRVNDMEALPRCVQQPRPPILVGAGSPRMLELAGRRADIVGLHARMINGRIDRQAVADLVAPSIEAKIERIRTAARQAGRSTPRIQFSCSHVHVTDADVPPRHRSSWAEAVEAQMDVLEGSPAVLVGTAAECAEKILECGERFGISYWHLGRDVDAAGRIVEQLR